MPYREKTTAGAGAVGQIRDVRIVLGGLLAVRHGGEGTRRRLEGCWGDGEAIRSGLDLSHVDAQARPQDDLFGHVNGRWLTDYVIPADRATDGAFRSLFDRAEEQVRDLIADAARRRRRATGTDAAAHRRSVRQLHGRATVAAPRVQPLLDELALIDGAADADALAAVLGGLQRTGVGGGAGLYVDTDSKDSSRYLVHVNQSGIGLPDESYYRDPQHAEILAAYPGHIARMFALVFGGTPDDHAATAARIVALETELAAAHWDVVKRRDADLTYNLRTFADLAAEAPGFDWAGWVAALGSSPGAVAELVVRQPDYLTAFAALWSTEPSRRLEGLACWRLIHARAAYLTDELVAENFAFYGTTLSGTEEIRERWKRGVALVEDLMGDAVGKLYVERHFPPRRKARMDELVANLREAYRVSITGLEWMTPETRERALAKLDKFTAKIGYPKTWRDYSELVVRRDDLYGNYRRGHEVELRPRTGQARRAGGPRRVVHDAADRQRLLQPGHERDRVPGRDPAATVLRRRGRRRGQLRRHRCGDRA